MNIEGVLSGLKGLRSSLADSKPINGAILLIRTLEHEYITTRGLRCTDRNPAEVDPYWIKRDAFQLSPLEEN
ncbi:hypothetical protein [Occallatibacter riparius]|uniref:Uncharacterized protein n=1 Tax=Occallatibacter riparius TaxID=1002689 RepID=A0A9J7BPJ8_9BACT|nr:hypothetical protein [Occallatibacter riparius]UWZ82854.1 hypothetical protein MOP44_20075 [Occallatibacter riparius]